MEKLSSTCFTTRPVEPDKRPKVIPMTEWEYSEKNPVSADPWNETQVRLDSEYSDEWSFEAEDTPIDIADIAKSQFELQKRTEKMENETKERLKTFKYTYFDEEDRPELEKLPEAHKEVPIAVKEKPKAKRKVMSRDQMKLFEKAFLNPASTKSQKLRELGIKSNTTVQRHLEQEEEKEEKIREEKVNLAKKKLMPEVNKLKVDLPTRNQENIRKIASEARKTQEGLKEKLEKVANTDTLLQRHMEEIYKIEQSKSNK